MPRILLGYVQCKMTYIKMKTSVAHDFKNEFTRHFLRFCYSDKLELYEYQLTKFQKKTFKIAFMYHSQ